MQPKFFHQYYNKLELNSQFPSHLVTFVMNHLRIMVTSAGQQI